MPRSGFVRWMVTLSILLGPVAGGATNLPARAAVEDVARRHYAAYSKKDLAAIRSLWSEQSPDWKEREVLLREWFASPGGTAVTRLQLGAVEQVEDVATMPVMLRIRESEIRPRAIELLATSRRVMQLHRVAGVWKVWRETSPGTLFAEELYGMKSNEERRSAVAARRELLDGDLIRALCVVSNADRGRGNYGVVQSMADFTLEQAEALGDSSALGMALNASAGVPFAQSKFEQVLTIYKRALELEERAGNEHWIAVILGNIALVHRFVGEFDLALAATTRAIAITEKLGETSVLPFLLNNNAVIYRNRGDYRLAARTFQRSIEFAEASNQDAQVASGMNGLGLLYLKQGQLDLAESVLRKGLEIRERMQETPAIASSLNNLGSLYTEKQDWEKALAVFRRVLKMKEGLGDRGGVAITLRNIAVALRGTGRNDEALTTLDEALQISRKVVDKGGSGEALLGIAVTQLARRVYPEARDAAAEAAAYAFSTGHRENFWRARTVAGNAYRALGQRQEAYAAYREAIGTIETLRLQLSGSEVTRQQFLESRTSPYESLISLLVADEHPEEAFFVAEQAKARVLVETLRDGPWDVTKSFTEEQKGQEHELRVRMAAVGAELQRERGKNPKDPAALDSLQKSVDAARLAYDELVASAYARDPATRIRRGDAAPLDREGMIGFLRPRPATALIEYVVTHDEVLAFVVRLEGQELVVHAHRIVASASSLRKEAEAFRRQVAELDLGFRTRARALHELLLSSLKDDLDGIDEAVIVPDGALWGVPFQALESRSGKFLVEELPFFYAPSATALRAMEAKKTAVETRSDQAPLLAAFGNPLAGQGRKELPNSEREVLQLGKVYGKEKSRLFLRAAATESRLRSESAGVRFLHMATHGVFDDASPMHSYVVLSASHQGDDGIVEAWELMNGSAASELTVLSACETARGRFGSGEGVIGMTWAIFVAGCPTTVVSQWKVDSGSTTELMVAFHRGLRGQLEKSADLDFARALRTAQLGLLRGAKYRHPFYWAGFSVIGAGM
ncbi:MAG: CHAT domain-containing tetratricopeptide repeat protein [Thermoanaerobaculia bacterium]